MATKADFTAEEWTILQFAVNDAIAYTSLADPGFWSSFSEASAAAKYLAQQRGSADSLLIRDLAGDIKAKSDKELTEDRTNIAGEAADRIKQAAGIVAEKAPDDVEAFSTFIMGLATAEAAASKGITAPEQEALDRIKEALG